MTENEIEEKKNKKVRIKLQQLEEMRNYCENTYRCRHEILANALGETTDRCRRRCDTCLDTRLFRQRPTSMVDEPPIRRPGIQA